MTLGKTIIRVTCVDQRLVISSGPVIASGGLNEDKIVFDFCPLWNDFVKTAIFYRDKGQVYHAVLVDNTCLIPWEVTASEGEMYFGVFGVKGDITRTSEILRYKITAGAITEGAEPSDPTPDIYAQILEAFRQVPDTLNNHIRSADNPHNVTAKQVGAAETNHSHGRISNDGRIGDTSGMLIFTGIDGELTAVNVANARSILGITDVEIDNEVTDKGTNPISGAAVAAYVANEIAKIADYDTEVL
jgi:hypothetical protein